MKKKSSDNSVKLLYWLESSELPVGFRFNYHAQAQEHVNEIVGSRFWTEHVRLPKKVHIFSHGDLDWSENKSPNEIWLCKMHLTQAAVLHELAHFSQPEGGHGPRYVRFYLSLISHFMGLHYYTIFREAFAVNGIKF